MSKEEIKQYLRDQINSCIKRQHDFINDLYYLCYNKSYLRALKLSKITGQPVNIDDFKGCEPIFRVDTKNKTFVYYDKIVNYLDENYSIKYSERQQIIKEVFHEYDEYKDYKIW